MSAIKNLREWNQARNATDVPDLHTTAILELADQQRVILDNLARLFPGIAWKDKP